MKLAKYVKFREEKFGGVLFETRSEKVFTLNPDGDRGGARDPGGQRRSATIPAPPEGALRDEGDAIEREVAGVHRRAAAEGPGRRLTDVRSRRRTPAADRLGATSARRSTSPGRSRTSATSRACTASRKAARARRSPTSSTTTQVFARARAADGPRGALPVVLGRRADGASALLRDGRVRLRARRASSRSRPTATISTPENCARLKELGVKAVQVSLDGATRADVQPHARARRVRSRASKACATCALPACRSRSTSRPRRFNVARDRRRGRPRLRARRLQLLHRAHDVHRQRGQGLAPPRASTDAQYDDVLRRRCARKTEEYRGRMRVHFHEVGLLEELRYRLQHPAALLIVLPNGLVKLINALPFICGDLRTQTLAEIWANFQRAWQRPARRAVHRRPRHRSAARRDAAPMGLSVSTPPTGTAAPRSPWQRLWLRAAAWCATASSSTPGCCPICSAPPGPTPWPAPSTRRVFWSGLGGVVLAVIGVEAFNEYFDSRMGTDRVFNPADLPPMSGWRALARHRRVRRRARGRHLPHATAAAGRSSPSRCSAARRRSSTWRRRSAGPTAAWASS